MLVESEAEVNGVRLHLVEAGGPGPLVLLLHGFPDFWYSWRLQLPALAQAGYRAVAPDLRGYNRSAKPAGIAAYSIEHLVDDVAALVGHLGARRAVIAGHDWGGAIAWHTALTRPDVVDRLVVVNAPHPRAFMRDVLLTGQALRSLYQLWFQLPHLPEASIRAGDFCLLRRTLARASSRPGAFTPDDIERYVEAMRQPGALTAALNYYRAIYRRPIRRTRDEARRTIDAPVLVLWGERDPYLGTSLTRGLDRWVPHLTVHRFPDAGHWVHLDEPDRVNQAIINFIPAGSPATEAASQ